MAIRARVIQSTKKPEMLKSPQKRLFLALIFGQCWISACAQSIVRWQSSVESDYWRDRGMLELTEKAVSDSPTIEIDTTIRYQAIEGFGGCFNELGWSALNVLDSAGIETVLGELFDPVDGCRFSLGRVPIGANDYATEWYSLSDSADDYRMEHFSINRDRQALIPYIKRAMRHKPGLRIWGSPWSPPIWMKENNAYALGNNTLRWNDQVLDALALYFEKFVRAYRDEGVNVYAVHVQNEPSADAEYPSCLWSGEQMRDFIRDHLGPAFKNRNVNAEIWLGTINYADYGAFAGTVLADSAASAYITGVGYQWDGKIAIGQCYAGHPEKKLMMTEQECGDGENSWEYGEEVFNLLLHYFYNGANSQMQWNMVLDETGKSTWNWVQNAMITINRNTGSVTYNPQFYIVKHFSRFIDSGAVRIASWGRLNEHIAFLNPDGSVVLVAANMTGLRRRISVAIGGKIFVARVPARSCNTFVIDNDATGCRGSPAEKKIASAATVSGSDLVYHLSGPAVVSVTLFDATGRMVRTISPQSRMAGTHRLSPDPLHRLASGIYIVKLTTDGRPFRNFRFIAR